MESLKLTLTCHLDFDPKMISIIEEIRLNSSKFYNMVLFEIRQGNILELNDYYYLFREHFRHGYLQTHTYMNAIKMAIQDMKSYFELLKKYKKNPKKYQNPGKPRYKHVHNSMEAAFLKTAIRFKNGNLLLSIGKKMKTEKQIKAISVRLPDEVYSLLSDKQVKMVKISYDKYSRKYITRIVYEVKEKKLKETGDLMSLDLGVSNLAAITFMESTDNYLLDGNILKSKIATYNKELKESYSKEMSVTGNQKFKLTNKMKRQMRKRKGYIENYIHTASRKIVDIAIAHDVKKIVIGDFKTIKSENHAKYFVQIPHTNLIKQLHYKGKLEGIEVVMQKESFTSSVSALDLELVNKAFANKKRRVVRGLFKSSFGYINSDINGSLNIMMKYDMYKNIPRLIKQVRDKGLRENPIRLLVI